MSDDLYVYEPIDRWSAPRNPKRCKASVYTGRNVRPSQCARKSTHDGWCVQHAKKYGKQEAK